MLQWPCHCGVHDHIYNKLGAEATEYNLSWAYMQTFVAVAWIIGDGLFNIVRVFIITISSIMKGPERMQTLPLSIAGQHVHSHATESTAATNEDPARLKNMIAPAGDEAGGLALPRACTMANLQF